MKRNNTRKVPKSFRLSEDVADLLQKAAEHSGLSEGEVAEGCIVNQVHSVLLQKQILRHPEAVEALVEAGRVRPRQERSDKGRKKRSGDSGPDGEPDGESDAPLDGEGRKKPVRPAARQLSPDGPPGRLIIERKAFEKAPEKSVFRQWL